MVLAERFPVPVEGVDAGGVSLGFVFAVAAIVLFGWQAGVIVAAGGPTVTHLIGHRPPLRVAYNGSMFALAALAGGARRSSRSRRRSVGALIARVAVCGVPLLLGRQPRADQRGARRQLRQAVLQADLGQREADDGAVRADGVGGADARRALGALAGALDGARRPAARDRALPALDVRGAEGDAARAHRPADRASATTATSTSGCSASSRRRSRTATVAHALPRRHRRLQADQRPLRPSGRRPRARAGRGAAAAGRRELPARRRRVRRPPPRPRRARRRRGRALDRRARRARRSSTRSAR